MAGAQRHLFGVGLAGEFGGRTRGAPIAVRGSVKNLSAGILDDQREAHPRHAQGGHLSRPGQPTRKLGYLPPLPYKVPNHQAFAPPGNFRPEATVFGVSIASIRGD